MVGPVSDVQPLQRPLRDNSGAPMSESHKAEAATSEEAVAGGSSAGEASETGTTTEMETEPLDLYHFQKVVGLIQAAFRELWLL